MNRAWLVAVCCFAAHSAASCFDSARNAGGMELVASRLREQYLGLSSCSSVCTSAMSAATSQLSDGSWADVHYNDSSRTTWEAMVHWDKVLAMTRAFNCPACNNSGYNSSVVLDSIFLGCDFWIGKNFQDPNWWWNDIGMPMTAIQVYMLLFAGGPRGGVLNASHIDSADLLWEGAETWAQWTGQNRIWTRTIVMQKGLLHANESSVNASFEDLFSIVVVEDEQADDGIMADGSFHQHGAQLQSGSYGSAFFVDVANLIYLSLGTTYEIANDRGGAFAKMALDGEQWMLRTYPGNIVQHDLNVKGREVTRAPGRLTFSAVPIASQMENMTFSGRGAEFQAFAARLREVPTNTSTKLGSTELVGDRHFYLSDYHVHRENGWQVGIHMFSNRTYNAECVNAEGQISWHLSDGLTTVNVRGDEYAGIFPVWDWTNLPGTTGWQGAPEETPCDPVKQLGLSLFVGGVSDGTVGAAAFDYKASDFYGNDYNGSRPGQLTARKGWFFWRGGFVALGANITSGPSSGFKAPVSAGVGPIATTALNQALLTSDVTLSNGSTLPFGKVHDVSMSTWIHHGNIGYVPLDSTTDWSDNQHSVRAVGGPTILASLVSQNGSWAALNPSQSTDDVNLDVFTLELVHGPAPVINASYAYAVLPAVAASDMPSAVRSLTADVEVKANSPSVQAVRFNLTVENRSVLQAIVYEAAQEIEGGGLGWHLSNFSAPCMLQLSESATQATDRATSLLTITASDPTQNIEGLSLLFSIDRVVTTSASVTASGSLESSVICTPNSDRRSSTVIVQLGAGIHAGASVSGSCQENSHADGRIFW